MCGEKIIRSISNDVENVFIAFILDFSAFTFSLPFTLALIQQKNVYH